MDQDVHLAGEREALRARVRHRLAPARDLVRSRADRAKYPEYPQILAAIQAGKPIWRIPQFPAAWDVLQKELEKTVYQDADPQATSTPSPTNGTSCSIQPADGALRRGVGGRRQAVGGSDELPVGGGSWERAGSSDSRDPPAEVGSGREWPQRSFAPGPRGAEVPALNPISPVNGAETAIVADQPRFRAQPASAGLLGSGMVQNGAVSLDR